MRTVRTGLYPIARLEKGATLLAAAETVDVTPIKRRFDAFAAVNLTYTGAHGAVEAAEAQLRECQAVVNLCNAEQNEMIDRMARHLIMEGHARANPFADFGMPSPSLLQDLNYGEKAKAIHALAATLRGDATLGKPTQRAAEAAEGVARRMEAELVPFEKYQATARTARNTREVAADAWDKAWRGLRHDAQAAALCDGQPGLLRALFPPPIRSRGKVDGAAKGNGNGASTATAPAPSPNSPSPPVTDGQKGEGT